MKGIISTVDLDDSSLVRKAKASPGLVGRDLVREVLPDQPRDWQEPLSEWTHLSRSEELGARIEKPDMGDETRSSLLAPSSSSHVVALDFGMKWNIPRYLYDMGCRVTILPGTATAADVLAQSPDGVFLSNGPGDPEPLEYAIRTIRDLLGKKPIFGICLGHQLLGLACGAKTFKLKFGHRGANHPVQNLQTGAVEITSQNHGFAVEEASLPNFLEITHRSLNDGTIEGLEHREVPAYSVQYHPEASAGPHDSHYHFRRFYETLLGAHC
jgi:carbamoyl-phosphate synthase small subunit